MGAGRVAGQHRGAASSAWLVAGLAAGPSRLRGARRAVAVGHLPRVSLRTRSSRFLDGRQLPGTVAARPVAGRSPATGAADARIVARARATDYRHATPRRRSPLTGVAGVPLNPEAADALPADARRRPGRPERRSPRSRATAASTTSAGIFLNELAARGRQRIGRPYTNAEIASGAADAAIDDVLRLNSIPGFSLHHTGDAVDLDGPRWLARRRSPAAPPTGGSPPTTTPTPRRTASCPSYPVGAVAIGPEPEPWEFTYVGVTADPVRRQRGARSPTGAPGGARSGQLDVVVASEGTQRHRRRLGRRRRRTRAADRGARVRRRPGGCGPAGRPYPARRRGGDGLRPAARVRGGDRPRPRAPRGVRVRAERRRRRAEHAASAAGGARAHQRAGRRPRRGRRGGQRRVRRRLGRRSRPAGGVARGARLRRRARRWRCCGPTAPAPTWRDATGLGANHGYRRRIAVPSGVHDVCAYAISPQPAEGNRLLGCRRVWSLGIDPAGDLDRVAGVAEAGRVEGWAVDGDLPGTPSTSTSTSTGSAPRWRGPTAAARRRRRLRRRPDHGLPGSWLGRPVRLRADARRLEHPPATRRPAPCAGRAVSGSVPAHGFTAVGAAGRPGEHTVCAYAISPEAGEGNVAARVPGRGGVVTVSVPMAPWHSAAGSARGCRPGGAPGLVAGDGGGGAHVERARCGRAGGCRRARRTSRAAPSTAHGPRGRWPGTPGWRGRPRGGDGRSRPARCRRSGTRPHGRRRRPRPRSRGRSRCRSAGSPSAVFWTLASVGEGAPTSHRWSTEKAAAVRRIAPTLNGFCTPSSSRPSLPSVRRRRSRWRRLSSVPPRLRGTTGPSSAVEDGRLIGPTPPAAGSRRARRGARWPSPRPPSTRRGSRRRGGAAPRATPWRRGRGGRANG